MCTYVCTDVGIATQSSVLVENHMVLVGVDKSTFGDAQVLTALKIALAAHAQVWGLLDASASDISIVSIIDAPTDQLCEVEVRIQLLAVIY